MLHFTRVVCIKVKSQCKLKKTHSVTLALGSAQRRFLLRNSRAAKCYNSCIIEHKIFSSYNEQHLEKQPARN